LTWLSLSGCSSLTSLPDSIGQLQPISSLDLEWCKALAGREAVVAKLTARNVKVRQ